MMSRSLLDFDRFDSPDKCLKYALDKYSYVLKYDRDLDAAFSAANAILEVLADMNVLRCRDYGDLLDFLFKKYEQDKAALSA